MLRKLKLQQLQCWFDLCAYHHKQSSYVWKVSKFCNDLMMPCGHHAPTQHTVVNLHIKTHVLDVEAIPRTQEHVKLWQHTVSLMISYCWLSLSAWCTWTQENWVAVHEYWSHVLCQKTTQLIQELCRETRDHSWRATLQHVTIFVCVKSSSLSSSYNATIHIWGTHFISSRQYSAWVMSWNTRVVCRPCCESQFSRCATACNECAHLSVRIWLHNFNFVL